MSEQEGGRRYRVYISQEVRDRLLEMGKMGENFDDVLRRVLGLPPNRGREKRGRITGR